MAVRPVIPTGEEVYNSIMQEIDTDLLTQNIPTLEKKYAGETEAERTARNKRYMQAYKEYDKQYDNYVKNLRSQVKVYKKEAMKSAEQKEQAKEASLLKKLEQSFS